MRVFWRLAFPVQEETVDLPAPLSSPSTVGNPFDSYAEGGTRTRTPCGATPSRWCVCQFHHFGEVDYFLSLLLLRRLLRRGRRSRRCFRSRLLLRLSGRSLTLCRRLLLLRAFSDYGRAAGLVDQNRERQR